MTAILAPRSLEDVGRDLVHHCIHEAPFSARRGVLDELFPFVHFASRRMSARAISRWLEEEKGIKLSDVTISKALRQPERGWRQFWDTLEANARIFCAAHPAAMVDVLFKADVFEALQRSTPTLAGESQEAVHVTYNDYTEAASALEDHWFALPEALRALGRVYLEPIVEALDAKEEEEVTK